MCSNVLFYCCMFTCSAAYIFRLFILLFILTFVQRLFGEYKVVLVLFLYFYLEAWHFQVLSHLRKKCSFFLLFLSIVRYFTFFFPRKKKKASNSLATMSAHSIHTFSAIDTRWKTQKDTETPCGQRVQPQLQKQTNGHEQLTRFTHTFFFCSFRHTEFFFYRNQISDWFIPNHTPN